MLLPDEEEIMIHPLKVYYKGGGKFILLRWWNQSEQWHVILSPSIASLKIMVQAIATRNEECNIKDWCRVQIVAPSMKMCREAYAIDVENKVNDFLMEVSCYLQELEKDNKSLPKCFSKCQKWESKYHDDDDEPGKAELEGHYSCKNCNHSFRLVGMTPQQFYEKYYPSWRLTFPGYKYEDKLAVYSEAEVATDNESIWMAATDFGSHCRGIDFHQYDANNTRPVLFYFKILEKLDNKFNTLQNILMTVKKEQRRKSEQLAKDRDLEMAEEHNKTIGKILSVLNG